MERVPSKAEKQGSVERVFRWDEHFNRRLGVISIVAAGVFSIAGAPVAAGYAALFGGGNLAAAEIGKRIADSQKK